MADVLLTHAYFLDEDEKERQVMKPYPPLGLLYVSAYLRRAGFAVEVFDGTFATFGDLAARLDATDAPVLGIYANLTTRASTLRIVAGAKARGLAVVLGGPEPGNYPGRYLDAGADVVVVGEGEETLAELLPRLASGGVHRLHGVAGTVFRDEGGAIVTNPPRAQIADIDTLPWPDRERIDVSRYVDVWRRHHGMGSVNLITARGCPYRCRWCSHAVFGFTHRRRNPVDCADELQHLVDRYAPDQVWYADDVFTINHRWLRAYREELARRGVRVPFETISRADRMMREDVLEALAAMGCWRIWIGSESGSQKVLDAMERGVSVEQVRWAAAAARRHGIQVGMFLMWGYEGETVDDIEATVEHVKQTNPDVFFTTVAYPIKNTKYWDDVADRVALPGHWDESTDRDVQVLGRPGRDYYALADQWLRGEVEASRLEASDPAEAERHRRRAAAARAELRFRSGFPAA